ncbi:hypothetical protein V7166_22640 [Bacillus thuringiensis]
MKSSDSQLKGRGKITFEDLQHYNNHQNMELLEWIQIYLSSMGMYGDP